VRQILVRRPDRTVEQLRPPFVPFTDTTEPGFYSVREIGGAGQSAATFAVNLLPSRSLPAGGPQILRFGHGDSGESRGVKVPVNLAWILGVVALAALSAEWWVGLRR
jgi:hypothetical protein